MSDDHDKALRDMLAYGTGVMMDGKHVPLDQYLLDDYIVLFGNNDLPPEKLAALERMEQAIRADERAKVWEEAAKVVEAMIDKAASDLGDRADMALLDAAAALRAMIAAQEQK